MLFVKAGVSFSCLEAGSLHPNILRVHCTDSCMEIYTVLDSAYSFPLLIISLNKFGDTIGSLDGSWPRGGGLAGDEGGLYPGNKFSRRILYLAPPRTLKTFQTSSKSRALHFPRFRPSLDAFHRAFCLLMGPTATHSLSQLPLNSSPS